MPRRLPDRWQPESIREFRASAQRRFDAHAAGMLPYQIIAAVRKNDSVTREQAQQAFLEEGASRLLDPQTPQLRFATEEEAEACRQRLLHRFPGTDDVWIILREITDQDAAYVQDWEQIEER